MSYSSYPGLPTDFKGSVEQFQATMRILREKCEEIEASSKSIDDTDFSDLSRKFSSLIEEVEVLSGKVHYATVEIDAISTAFRRYL